MKINLAKLENLVKKNKRSLIIGWLVCVSGSIFYCYEYLLRIEPSVIVPELMKQFNVTAASLGMLTALYYYAYTPMQLIVGMLVDRYGTRKILTLAVIACVVGSFIFNDSTSLYWVGVGRFLIGFGSSFAFVGMLKLAAEWLPKHHFALFTGFATLLGMVGAMVGTIGLSVLTHTIGWQRTLHIGALIGVVLIPIMWLVVRDTPKWKKAHRATKISFKEVFAGYWEIIKNHQMWISGIIGCIFYLSLSIFAELWGIPFLRAVYHLEARTAAFACSMVFLGWLVGSPLSGWLSDKTKTRKVPLIFGGVFSALAISFVIFPIFHLSLPALCVMLFLFGLFSSVEIICFAISRENNPTHVAATAVGFTNLLVMMGGMVFQPAIGVVLDFSWTRHAAVGEGIRVYTAQDFQYAFWVLPVLILVAVVLSLILRETYPHKDKEWDEFDKNNG